MTDENLYCGSIACGKKITDGEMSLLGRNVYHFGYCEVYASATLARKFGRPIVANFRHITMEEALRLLVSGGIETRVDPQENRK